MRLQLVVNPAAGRGRALRLLPVATAALAHHDLVVTTTRSLEHADALVEEAVRDERVVVAMGGDGLVGRAAGAVAAHDGVLAVLPGGRGNDFARAVGVPLDLAAACRSLDDSVERRVDLGDVDGRAFVGIASVGFDSAVQERVLRSRLPLGPAVYRYGALVTALTWRHASFTAVLDGERFTSRGWAVAAANSGVYGGGMRLAPDASVSDGTLDVVVTAATSTLHFLRVLPKIFRGTHVHDPAVTVRRGRSLTVDADRPFRVFADGDPLATLPCTVSVRPGALRLLLPREA